MHFMVFVTGEDLSFKFSNCGSDWKTGTFKKGIASAELDLIRSSLVLDCLGCRVDAVTGPVWHISRDDVSAIDVLNICRSICAGRQYTSIFDLAAMVARALCSQLNYLANDGRAECVAAEALQSFFANEKTTKEKQ